MAWKWRGECGTNEKCLASCEQPLNNKVACPFLEMKQKTLIVFALFGTLLCARLEARDLMEAGEEQLILLPVEKSKSAEGAARLASREQRLGLAATAFGLYLRVEQEPTSLQAVKTIVNVSKRNGMHDRVGFLLSFSNVFFGKSRARQVELIQNLVATGEPRDPRIRAAGRQVCTGHEGDMESRSAHVTATQWGSCREAGRLETIRALVLRMRRL